jgi:hypothetical protein
LILPFIAFFAVGTLFALSSILLTSAHWNISTVKTSFEINYTNNYQNGALSIYATVALFLLFLCLPRYPADQWLRMRRLKKIIAPLLGY